jgi:hypothetical protein
MITSDRQLPLRASKACAARHRGVVFEFELAVLVQRVDQPARNAFGSQLIGDVVAQIGAHLVVEREEVADIDARIRRTEHVVVEEGLAARRRGRARASAQKSAQQSEQNSEQHRSLRDQAMPRRCERVAARQDCEFVPHGSRAEARAGTRERMPESRVVGYCGEAGEQRPERGLDRGRARRKTEPA